MAQVDREDLQGFIAELRQLLEDVTDGTTHPDLLSPARRNELRAAFLGLGDAFTEVSNALGNSAIDHTPVGGGPSSLRDADLIGPSRDSKVRGWRRALERFRSFPTRRALDRVYRWANMLLESLVAVVPPAGALKELKQYAENLNKDAMEDAADAGKGPV